MKWKPLLPLSVNGSRW